MTPDEIKGMQDAFAAFKSANEESLAEVKKFGSALGETTEKLTKSHERLDALEVKINARMDREEHTTELKKVLGMIEELEAKIARKGGSGGGPTDEDKIKSVLLRSNFFKCLRSGFTPEGIKSAGLLQPDDLKALIAGNDTAGGYLAPLEYVAEIIANVVEYSPIRGLASTRSTSRMGVQIPKRTGTASASWVTETGSRTETTNPTFGMLEVRSHECYAMTKVSKQELEDAMFDLESFLRAEFAEQFGVLEGTAFVSGDSNGKPEGLMTNSSISEVVSGHASQITADGLIALYYELKEQYLNNSTFVMNRSTLKTIRQLKDGQGNYLWAAGIKTDARPATILDRPYVTAIDMPSISANTYPVIFGDFRRGYMILDRVAMEVMVDAITSKSTGMVEFSARKRVGGQVTLPEALKKMKISA